jgi:Domain of unknown function (DUF4431)
MSRILVASAAVVLSLATLGCVQGPDESRTLVIDAPGKYVIDDCLPYEPAVVELTGRVERQTFPGRPNYESIEAGDEPETYWILHLSEPACTRQDDEAERNLTRMQLLLSAEQYDAYRPLLGQGVVARGTLMEAVTGHHHTAAMLRVQSLHASAAADTLP